MKRILFPLTILTLLCCPYISMSMDMNVFDSMMARINTSEYAPVEEFLSSEKQALSKDPEYYVLLLNYVFHKGTQENVVVAKGNAKPGELELRDTETGEAVGFIGSRVSYDKEMIISGIMRTQSALINFNERLDIHFGIITIAEKIDRLDIVGDQLVRILKVSKDIENKWLWGPINTMDGDPKEFMIQNILRRTANLFYAKTSVANEAFIKTSMALIEHYPELVYGYANLGTIYMTTEQYDLAQEYYIKALEIDPDDEIVAANMKKLKELINFRPAK